MSLFDLLAHNVALEVGARHTALVAGNIEVALVAPAFTPGVSHMVAAASFLRVASSQNGVETSVVSTAVALIDTALVVEERSADTEGDSDWSSLEAGLDLSDRSASLVVANAVADVGRSPILSVSASLRARQVHSLVWEASFMDQTLDALDVV